MTQLPDPPRPQPDTLVKAINALTAVLKDYQPDFKQFLIVGGLALTLATGVWNGCHNAKQESVDAVHADVRSNKDIAAKVEDTQQRVVNVAVRGTKADVAALKDAATTQPAPEAK